MKQRTIVYGKNGSVIGDITEDVIDPEEELADTITEMKRVLNNVDMDRIMDNERYRILYYIVNYDNYYEIIDEFIDAMKSSVNDLKDMMEKDI